MTFGTVSFDGRGAYGLVGNGSGLLLFVNDGASVVLRDLPRIVNGSSAGNGGFALVGAEASMTVVGSRVERHAATGHGGCVYVAPKSHLVLRGSTIAHCVAGRNGGGVASYKSSTVTLVDSVIRDCDAGSFGGGLYVNAFVYVSLLSLIHI